MTRTRVRRLRTTVTVTAVLVGAVWAASGASAAGDRVEPVAGVTYVVRPGDTLWAIAERAAPGEDPRRLVDAISAANDVEAGALVPGQTLVVPSLT